MKNYLKTNLTAKLFVLVCSVLIGTSLLICGLFAVIMPQSYVELQNETFEQELQDLTASIINIEDAKQSLENFALQSNVYMELYDENGDYIEAFGDEQIFIDLRGNKVVIISDWGTNDEHTTLENLPESSKPSEYEFRIESKTYILTIYGSSTESVNEVTVILQNIIPWIIAVVIILSFIIAIFLSRFITKPIKAINESAKKIANLSFDVLCVENRSDELGELSKTINLLSSKLNKALSSLKSELEIEKALEESQRLFFSAASHELKTPLTVIKGNLEGMVYGYKEYKDKDTYIAKTLRTATQMEHLIGEILVFSTMRGNEYVLNHETFNLREVVDDLLIHFAEIIEIKQFDMKTGLENVAVTADKKLFTKGIQNIISNALHYSPEKQMIKITLTSERFSVENTGIVISDDEIEKLFEPFYRVDKSRSRQTGGSGLGLHFVKTILDKHNLNFEIVSNTNNVIFTIYF